MTYAIIGSGNIGSALARAFARQQVPVGIANTRGPASLAPLVNELGPAIVAQSLAEALNADILFLAVPFSAHSEVAKQRASWADKILVDTTNALHVRPEDLNGQLSSDLVAEAFSGARLVKAFNHLPAAQLSPGPTATGDRQAIFLASNDPDASTTVASLVTQLGFAPIELGRLDRGGVPLHVVDGRPGGLLFQNLIKQG